MLSFWLPIKSEFVLRYERWIIVNKMLIWWEQFSNKGVIWSLFKIQVFNMIEVRDHDFLKFFWAAFANVKPLGSLWKRFWSECGSKMLSIESHIITIIIRRGLEHLSRVNAGIHTEIWAGFGGIYIPPSPEYTPGIYIPVAPMGVRHQYLPSSALVHQSPENPL